MRSLNSDRIDKQRKILGGKWKPLVLILLFPRPERFNKIKQLLVGVSANQLTKCVRELERDKLIQKVEEMYCLTTAGHKVTELIIEIKNIIESIDT